MEAATTADIESLETRVALGEIPINKTNPAGKNVTHEVTCRRW